MRRSYAVAGAAPLAWLLAVTAVLVVVPMLGGSGHRRPRSARVWRATLEVKGGAHLSLRRRWPSRWRQVSLSAPEGMDGQLHLRRHGSAFR